MGYTVTYKLRNMDFYRKCSFCGKEYLVLLRGQPKKDSVPEHNLNETNVLGIDPVTLLPVDNVIQRCHYCGKVDNSLIKAYKKNYAPFYFYLARGFVWWLVFPLIGIIWVPAVFIEPAFYFFYILTLSVFLFGYFGIKNFDPNNDKMVKAWLKWWNREGKTEFNYYLEEKNIFKPYDKEEFLYQDVAKFDSLSTNSKKESEIEFHNQGVNLQNQNRFKEAITYYDKALEINPAKVITFANKALCLNYLGRIEDAIVCYKQALEHESNIKGNLWLDRGVCHERLKQYSKAIFCYDKAIAINPKDELAWYNKGVSLGFLGRSTEAISCYDRATFLKPNFQKAWANKGVRLADLGKIDESRQAFNLALQLDPDDEIAKCGREELDNQQYDEKNNPNSIDLSVTDTSAVNTLSNSILCPYCESPHPLTEERIRSGASETLKKAIEIMLLAEKTVSDLDDKGVVLKTTSGKKMTFSSQLNRQHGWQCNSCGKIIPHSYLVNEVRKRKLLQLSGNKKAHNAALWMVAKQIIRSEICSSKPIPDKEGALEIMRKFDIVNVEHGLTDDCFRAAEYILDNYDTEKALNLFKGLIHFKTVSQVFQPLLKIDQYFENSARLCSGKMLQKATTLVCFTMSFLPLKLACRFRKEASPEMGERIDSLLHTVFPPSIEALKEA